MNKSIKKIVIAGGGTAGWMAAAAFSKKFGQVLDITLVESEDIGTIGVGESTIPPLRSFHQLLGIDEQEFMSATSATFKMGVQFEGWGNVGDSYIHSFGLTGQETWMAGFQNLWLRGRELGVATDFGDYCFELVAAKQNKFAIIPNGNIQYSYHLDATRYAQFLRKFCEKNQGLTRVEGKIIEVAQDSDTGFIESLKLESGEVVEGDLFIDCTGFRGLLIEKTLKTGYESWGHWLSCDAAAVVQTASTGPAIPYTRAIAHDAGWRWKIPLQKRVGNGLVYCSQNLSDDEAINRLTDAIDGDLLTDPRIIKYQTGRRLKAWNKNCIALGLSGGFIEPLESTGLHLFMAGIIRLMQLFPYGGVSPAIVNEFNSQSRREVENIRDFIILHYYVISRDDSPFWRSCRNMDIPASLLEKINLFKETARIFKEDGDPFRVESWAQVMIGQGITPERYHQLSRDMSDREVTDYLAAIKARIAKNLTVLPQHQEFIDHYCKDDSVM